MLGLWDNGAPTSYVNKAGKEYAYFDMGSEWRKAEDLVNNNKAEMWRINKQFIDEQYKANKKFWFSHDPFLPKTEQFFSDEVLYLIDLGVKDFVKKRGFMESYMVDRHEIIKNFFKENLSHFSLINEYSYFRYWGIIYVYKSMKIKITEEIGIMIDIFIENTQYSLWQYDRSVINKSGKTEEEILYQLNVLKHFLNEVGY